MKTLPALSLCCLLVLPLQAAAYYSTYYDDNPFVEAMLRMMEIFGLIDRDRLPLSVPYLPGHGQFLTPGLGGLGAYPLSGLGSVPGISPLSGPGMPGLPGMGAFPGTGQLPGLGGWPYGTTPGSGWVPGGWGNPAHWGRGQFHAGAGRLDGIWELANGTFVVIRGGTARLYLSHTRYQDFAIRYDRRYLWWQPLHGGSPSRYLYETRQGRMILSDDEGNLLLMRRRR